MATDATPTTADAATSLEPTEVLVGELVGEGAAADLGVRILLSDGRSLDLTHRVGAGEAEPRADHRRVGELLGYARPHKFTDLVRSHRERGFIDPPETIVPAEGKNGRGRPGAVFLLTRDEIVYLIGKAETPTANRLMAVVAKLFVRAMDALHPRTPATGLSGEHLVSMMREALAPIATALTALADGFTAMRADLQALRHDVAQLQATDARGYLAGVLGPHRAKAIRAEISAVTTLMVDRASRGVGGWRSTRKALENQVRDAARVSQRDRWEFVPSTCDADVTRSLNGLRDRGERIAKERTAAAQQSLAHATPEAKAAAAAGKTWGGSLSTPTRPS